MEEKKAKRPKWKTLLGNLFVIWAICFLIIGVTEKDPSLFVAVAVFAVGAVLLFRKETPERIEAKRKRAEQKQQSREKLDKKIKLMTCTMQDIIHVSGLPLANGASCDFIYGEKEFVIEGGGLVFRLPVDKVYDVEITTDKEIQDHYVSNPGAAVAGAMWSGGLAALIMGGPEKRTTTTIRNFLIVTYDKDGYLDYIAFNVTKQLSQAKNIKSYYDRSDKKESTEILL